MSNIIPDFYNISEKIESDNSTEYSQIFQVLPSDGNKASTLNSTQVITFSYKGDQKYCRLSSPRTGFRIRGAFLTKIGANNRRNAQITLSSNWALHLFRLAEFRIGSESIEAVEHPGISSDILYHTKGTEFKDDGQLLGFFPDSSQTADTNPLSNFKFNDAPANLAASANLSACTASTNSAFNSGFKKRLEAYNYDVANDDTVREVEVFVPLSCIFGFCEDYDKLIKFLSFDINLHRFSSAEYTKCVYGAEGTAIVFGQEGETTGLKSMILEIEQVFPVPTLSVELDKIYTQGNLEIGFLQREGRLYPVNNAQTYEVNMTKKSIPRFLFAIFHGKSGNASQLTALSNYQLFRNVDLKYIQCNVDNQIYPNIQQNAEFKKNIFSKFYQEYLTVCRKLAGDGSMSFSEYKDLYPIFAVDMTNQKEKLNNTSINFSISISRNTVEANDDAVNLPKNVDMYVLTLNEVKYSMDVMHQTLKRLA